MKAALFIVLAAVARAAFEFETHYDATVSGGTNNVGSCYNTQYSYYTNFACNTVTRNCLDELQYCNSVTDIHKQNEEEVLAERNRRIAIIVPCSVVGFCLVVCIFTCIVGSFGYKYGRRAYERRQAQKGLLKQGTVKEEWPGF